MLMDFREFIKDIKRQPQIYTPWAVITAKTLEKQG